MPRAEPLLLPAAHLLAWLCLVLLLAWMPPWWLAALTAALALLLLAWRRTLLSSALWRMRYLLLSLLLLFGWTTPGDAVLAVLWAPTWQGLELGATHAARLLVAVWLVRLIWLSAGHDAMLAALYQLCAPLARLGVPADTLALRLGLTLYHAERLASEPLTGLWREMRILLQPAMVVAGPDRVELHIWRWRWQDRLFVAASVVLTGFLMKVWA